MKKILILSIVGLALLVARAQQVTIAATTTYSIPPVTWSGADAQVILAQVQGITNASGQPIMATNSAGQPILNATNLVPGTLYLVLPVTADDTGTLQSIGISGHK